MSPTTFVKGRPRFFFYANERSEPSHVHVQHHDAVAKFWLSPVSLAKNTGFSSAELSRAFVLVEHNETACMEKWHEFFSRKKNA